MDKECSPAPAKKLKPCVERDPSLERLPKPGITPQSHSHMVSSSRSKPSKTTSETPTQSRTYSSVVSNTLARVQFDQPCQSGRPNDNSHKSSFTQSNDCHESWTVDTVSLTENCNCSVITAQECEQCADIARNILQLYGKRLALSDYERTSKAPPSDCADGGGLLVVADHSCDCPEVDAESCPTCADFAIKMGVFISIYSKAENLPHFEKEHLSSCSCSYLSPIDCDICSEVILEIEQTFRKYVYKKPACPRPWIQTQSDMFPVTIALDCEMVGVIDKFQRNRHGRSKMVDALARCSIVDTNLRTVLDIYVKPEQPIADYRTRYSGIRKCHMKNAVPTDIARRRIIDHIKDKVIVGHTIRHDLAVIGHRHPTSMTRDIAQCQTLRRMYQHKQKSYNRLPIIGLKKLSAVLLGSHIQGGSHCSVEDALHTMKLYLLVNEPREPPSDCDSSSGSAADGEEASNNDNIYSTTSMFLDDKFWPAKDTEVKTS